MREYPAAFSMKPSTQEKYRVLMLLVEQSKAIESKMKKKKADLLAIMLKDEQESIEGELGTISISGRTTAAYPSEVNDRIAKIKARAEVNDRIAKIKARAEEKGQVEFKSSTFLKCNLSKPGGDKENSK